MKRLEQLGYGKPVLINEMVTPEKK